MSVTEVLAYTVHLEPLTPENFARFGDVAVRPTALRRRYLPTGLDGAEDARAISLWISSAAKIAAFPLRVTALERHPYSAQSFIPLDPGQYLVIVCEADTDGRPALTSMRAFLAGAHQSVTFARNVWHHSSTVLHSKMEFAVALGMTGRGDDDVFLTLDAEVTIVASPIDL
jgi:ureidoglycolate lyase